MNQNTQQPQRYQSPWLTSAIFGLITAVLFTPLCWRLTHRNLGPNNSDHLAHLEFAIELSELGKVLPHPLLHYTLLVLSPSTDVETMANTATVLYAVCLGVSALFTGRMLIHAAPQTAPVLLGWLAFAMTIAMALPNWWNQLPPPNEHEWWHFPRIYLGQISPNCWHNPTLIFTLPFVLALYWLFILEMEKLTPTSTIWIGVLMVVTTFAKPNYILAFAPVYALHLAWYAFCLPESWPSRIKTGILLQIKAFGLFVPAMVIQYIMLRNFSGDRSNMISLRPFATWQLYCPSQYIPFALLVGILFPLAVCCCYPRLVFKYLPLQRAWLVFDVALLQYILFVELERPTHANFVWGSIFADRVLFIQSTAFVLQQPASKKRTFCLFCLSLHFISGFFYTGKCLFTSGSIILN
jgi:hypothetical protein